MTCNHEEKHLTKRLINNCDHFGYQCKECGKWLSVKKATLTWEQRSQAVEFDQELPTRYWRSRTESMVQEQQAKSQKWWEDYTAYLLTPKWQDKRERVQACLKRKATQAHHLTYKHVFDEPLFDLVAVCEICHQAIHKRERSNEHSHA